MRGTRDERRNESISEKSRLITLVGDDGSLGSLCSDSEEDDGHKDDQSTLERDHDGGDGRMIVDC